MLLDISRIREREHVHREVRPDALARSSKVPEGYRLVGLTVLDLDATREGRQVRLQGRLDAVLQLECGRCLEPFEFSVHRDLDLFYLPQSENRGGGEREVADDDLAIAYYRDEVIDLAQVVREQFDLAVPMKPLCRADCRGLCPLCGANLNETSCACRPERTDPRLEGLRSLLDK